MSNRIRTKSTAALSLSKAGRTLGILAGKLLHHDNAALICLLATTSRARNRHFLFEKLCVIEFATPCMRSV
jgi:hypothetical protein